MDLSPPLCLGDCLNGQVHRKVLHLAQLWDHVFHVLLILLPEHLSDVHPHSSCFYNLELYIYYVLLLILYARDDLAACDVYSPDMDI